jgi:hypothetical protein
MVTVVRSTPRSRGCWTWGYTRILGALKNVGHRVSRSTIARIRKALTRRCPGIHGPSADDQKFAE